MSRRLVMLAVLSTVSSRNHGRTRRARASRHDGIGTRMLDMGSCTTWASAALAITIAAGCATSGRGPHAPAPPDAAMELADARPATVDAGAPDAASASDGGGSVDASPSDASPPPDAATVSEVDAWAADAWAADAWAADAWAADAWAADAWAPTDAGCTPAACDHPPAATCVGASTLRTYASAGTCSAGTCRYTYTDATCALGCNMGACSTCMPGTACDELVEVAAGYAHTCARSRSGRVACWGSNQVGELGDGVAHHASCGGFDCSLTPVVVAGLTDAVQITAGGYQTCALRASGSVACWGANSAGQLGDGTTTNRSTPTAVSGLTDAIQVAAGIVHTCALRASGAVV